MKGRPESSLRFLGFLRGREHVLHQVASRDVADRKLADATVDAVSILGDHQGRARRAVAAELLGRSLYLHARVDTHNHIAGEMALEQLSGKAKKILQDLTLDQRTLTSPGKDAAGLADKGWAPSDWVELAAVVEYRDEDLVREAMPNLRRLHLDLAT